MKANYDAWKEDIAVVNFFFGKETVIGHICLFQQGWLLIIDDWGSLTTENKNSIVKFFLEYLLLQILQCKITSGIQF